MTVIVEPLVMVVKVVNEVESPVVFEHFSHGSVTVVVMPSVTVV